MTNREYLIAQLSNPKGTADMESEYVTTVNMSIRCPYCYLDDEALCAHDVDMQTWDVCFKCKEQWLNDEA